MSFISHLQTATRVTPERTSKSRAFHAPVRNSLNKLMGVAKLLAPLLLLAGLMIGIVFIAFGGLAHSGEPVATLAKDILSAAAFVGRVALVLGVVGILLPLSVAIAATLFEHAYGRTDRGERSRGGHAASRSPVESRKLRAIFTAMPLRDTAPDLWTDIATDLPSSLPPVMAGQS